MSTVNVLKFQTLFGFLFSFKMFVFRDGIHKILVRIANREDLDQTASRVCTVCLGQLGRQLVFQNFRRFITISVCKSAFGFKINFYNAPLLKTTTI